MDSSVQETEEVIIDSNEEKTNDVMEDFVNISPEKCNLDIKEPEESNNQIIECGDNKKETKKIYILIILFIISSLFISRSIGKINDTRKIEKYESIITETHAQVLKFQEDEAERQRIRAEEELKAKIANRNKLDLTVEQIQQIKKIYSSSSEKKMVYLTFDDGPSANVTPLILDILKQENIKATFFVLGLNVRWNPEILKRIRDEGHYIANHSYTHNYDKLYANYESLMEEYNLCEQAIRDALGDPNYKTRIFRFPGGSTGGKYAKFKRDAKAQMEQQGIIFLDWNALTKDAEGVPTKESIMEDLIETVAGKNTVVLLMHDSSTKILTYETLTSVISYLREQGYEFGDMYDLIGE